jgi:hypothetical protein
MIIRFPYGKEQHVQPKDLGYKQRGGGCRHQMPCIPWTNQANKQATEPHPCPQPQSGPSPAWPPVQPPQKCRGSHLPSLMSSPTAATCSLNPTSSCPAALSSRYWLRPKVGAYLRPQPQQPRTAFPVSGSELCPLRGAAAASEGRAGAEQAPLAGPRLFWLTKCGAPQPSHEICQHGQPCSATQHRSPSDPSDKIERQRCSSSAHRCGQWS